MEDFLEPGDQFNIKYPHPSPVCEYMVQSGNQKYNVEILGPHKDPRFGLVWFYGISTIVGY